VTLPVRRPATYDDILGLPENVVGEIVAGELLVSPRPAGAHAIGASALGGALTPPFQFGNGGPGGWWIVDEPEVHHGDDVVVPDLAGWRRERLPEYPRSAFVTLSPDCVCEVLAPSTGRTDRTKKLPAYAQMGVRHLWLVDPAAETLEVFRLEGLHWVLLGAHGGDDVVRAAPFEEIALELRWLWGR
jgi:Uma2 family endonuclease